MNNLKFVVAVMAVFLFGCGTAPPPPNPTPLPVVQPDQQVVISQDLVTKCPPLHPLVVRQYDKEDTLMVFQTITNRYTVCSGRQSANIPLIQKAFNLNPASSVAVSTPAQSQNTTK